MKKITLQLFALVTLLMQSCSPEQIEDDSLNLSLDPNFRVTEAIINDVTQHNNRISLPDGGNEPCLSTNLIAGQHHIAGSVTVDVDGSDIIITYTTNEDWTIGATHLSIGNCAEQTIPTTGSGNPKVGHFEHSSTHSDGTNQVVYILDTSVLDDNYCFAAHAEVSGPTGGETAWAEGQEFEGNNWAMYVSALLSDCDTDDGGTPPIIF
ncbi:hypothetical protein [uncultured Dokdonia sp.]|uniref:hypothetical protein n=1 Tax=uncultured Dokdonia sp. TaxID=575653 RepID=UPI002616239D|nr:hypothetical protein [uncultured Dokdonia sp.]